MGGEKGLLSARIRDEAVPRLAIHVDAHLAVVGAVLVPELSLGIRIQVGSGNEEAIASVVELLRLGLVLPAEDGFYPDRVNTICGNDDVPGDDLARSQGNRRRFRVLSFEDAS